MATIKGVTLDSRKQSWFSSLYTAAMLSEHDGVPDSLGTRTWPIAVLTEEIRINVYHYCPKLALQHIWKAFGFSLLRIVSTCSLTNNWQFFCPVHWGVMASSPGRDPGTDTSGSEQRKLRGSCATSGFTLVSSNWWAQKPCVNRIWHPQDRPEVLPIGRGGGRFLY